MTVGERQGTETAPERPIHVVGFKCTDRQYVVMDSLASTFDPPTPSQAMRWLLSEPAVVEVIGRRVRGEL